MTMNSFLAERSRFFRSRQRHPNKVTLHPSDRADLLLVLKSHELQWDDQGREVIAGATVYDSKSQDVGRARFELEER